MFSRLSLKRSLQAVTSFIVVGLLLILTLFMHYAETTEKSIDRVIHVDGDVSFLLHEMWAQGLQAEQA